MTHHTTPLDPADTLDALRTIARMRRAAVRLAAFRRLDGPPRLTDDARLALADLLACVADLVPGCPVDAALFWSPGVHFAPPAADPQDARVADLFAEPAV